MNSLNLSEIKAVAFDIDGTLYRTWKFNIRMPFHFFIHCFFFLKYGLVRNELRKKEISGNIQQIQAEMMAKRLKCSPTLARCHFLLASARQLLEAQGADRFGSGILSPDATTRLAEQRGYGGGLYLSGTIIRKSRK